MEKKIIIIYNSKTGFTKKYADWLSEELSCPAVSYKDRNKLNLSAYDFILFGGGFHAGFINGIRWLKSNLPFLSNKEVIVFATGATPANIPIVQTSIKNNFTPDEWDRVKVFYLESGLCYDKMNLLHKIMMAMFRKMLRAKEGEDSEMYRAVCHSYDISSKDNIKPVLEYIASVM